MKVDAGMAEGEQAGDFNAEKLSALAAKVQDDGGVEVLSHLFNSSLTSKFT